MQLTLVSHYGEKATDCAQLIRNLQQFLAGSLGGSFRPYSVEQVHGTIVGLEGVRGGDRIRNENFRRYRHEERLVDLEGLLGFLRSSAAPDFTIQIGSFDAARDYGFISQGRHPFVRSFSVQGETAVAMGWPFENGEFPPLLDQLRRRLQQFGVLHKWHQREEDVDNDFFFVLGHVAGSATPEQRTMAEQHLREQMARMTPLLLPVTLHTLSFVAYTDRQLPPDTSRVFKVSDATTTAGTLAGVFDSDECG